MIKHSQSTQNNKFAISLQYLKKEIKKGLHFLHADEHQSFYKLGLMFLMEVARYVQSTQNMKLVIFLHCFYVLLWCKLFNILQGSSHVYCYILVFLHSQTRNFLPKHHNTIIKQHLCGEGLPSLLSFPRVDVFQ